MKRKNIKKIKPTIEQKFQKWIAKGDYFKLETYVSNRSHDFDCEPLIDTFLKYFEDICWGCIGWGDLNMFIEQWFPLYREKFASKLEILEEQIREKCDGGQEKALYKLRTLLGKDPYPCPNKKN